MTHKTYQRILLESAAHDLQRYRYPDIANAVICLRDIILLTHRIDIEQDSIENIEIDEISVDPQVRVSIAPYAALPRSSRSISTNEEIVFPLSIVDSLNPSRQAKIFGLQRRIEETLASRSQLIGDLEKLDSGLVDLEAELYNINYPDYN